MLNSIACTIVVMAALSIGASHPCAASPRLEGPTGRCLPVPGPLHVDHRLRTTVHAMWHRSPTFRRQVARVWQAEDVDTRLDIWPARTSSSRRAETVLRHDNGRLRAATVRIKLPNDERTIVELIAHELEHVIEQLDGVNLRRSAEQGKTSGGVRWAHDRAFETERAHRVGLSARDEYLRQSSAAACVELLP